MDKKVPGLETNTKFALGGLEYETLWINLYFIKKLNTYENN